MPFEPPDMKIFLFKNSFFIKTFNFSDYIIFIDKFLFSKLIKYVTTSLILILKYIFLNMKAIIIGSNSFYGAHYTKLLLKKIQSSRY